MRFKINDVKYLGKISKKEQDSIYLMFDQLSTFFPHKIIRLVYEN